MRILNKFPGVAVLTLTFTLPAFAGQIDLPKTNPAASPPPVTANGDIATCIAGQMDTPKAAGDIHTPVTTSDSVFQAALNLLRGVLALF